MVNRVKNSAPLAALNNQLSYVDRGPRWLTVIRILLLEINLRIKLRLTADPNEPWAQVVPPTTSSRTREKRIKNVGIVMVAAYASKKPNPVSL